MKAANDFVSSEKAAKYPMRIGRHVASSLSGFVAGVIAASIVWLTGIYIIKLFG